VSTLSQKSATVAENGETTATVALFCDSVDRLLQFMRKFILKDQVEEGHLILRGGEKRGGQMPIHSVFISPNSPACATADVTSGRCTKWPMNICIE